MTDTRWHDLHPELGTDPVPIEPYISLAYFELERQRLFRRVWLNVGREEAIPGAGNFFVQPLEVCRTSLIRMCGMRRVSRGWVRMAECRLPEPFADLEPFVNWALAMERERNRQRLNSTMAELQAFHKAMLPRMEAVIEYLNPGCGRYWLAALAAALCCASSSSRTAVA